MSGRVGIVGRRYVIVPANLEAICWTCQRAGWWCLCRWPKELMPGMKVVESLGDEERQKIVAECKYYWPDPGNHTAPIKLKYLR